MITIDLGFGALDGTTHEPATVLRTGAQVYQLDPSYKTIAKTQRIITGAPRKFTSPLTMYWTIRLLREDHVDTAGIANSYLFSQFIANNPKWIRGSTAWWKKWHPDETLGGSPHAVWIQVMDPDEKIDIIFKANKYLHKVTLEEVLPVFPS